MSTALNRSVFFRLLVIMLVMAALLLSLVAGFYFVLVLPSLKAAVTRHVEPHYRAIADTQPDLAAAQRFVDKLEMDMRFEGPGGGWSTDPSVPTAAAVLHRRQRGMLRHILHFIVPASGSYYVAQAANGTYVFAPRVSRDLAEAHNKMLLLLLFIMLGVLLAAYAVLKRALQPLRLLGAGVKRISEGQLDVVVQKRSQDEFGELTDAFNHMARRVRGMVQAREQLLLDVSHELRSPITRLKVALEMMPEDTRTQAMSADVQEMQALVSELLEWHRRLDTAELHAERVDLRALVQEVCSRFQDSHPGVHVTAAAEPVFVAVEADGVRTVLRNLIENALKYSLPVSKPIDVEVQENDTEVLVRVSDDGEGVPADELDSVFEPFFRSDRSRSKKTGGYGLGLSICKRIMEAHAGSIHVEPRQPRGSTFVMTFPNTPDS